ncbi:hypothetical protein D9758_011793 [Tetrapyrgos nigripes]|uniref:Uncharacterized protein n=1 Tax=Tetrapyrgos nigripes TaxID=182062 RepID=A0A8H5CWR0_9AGAR|nr:hypothetical protein D9758_011793 [Tetrapyrgos nigripes]
MPRFIPFLLPRKRKDDDIIVGKRTGGSKRAVTYVRKSSYANLRDYVPSHPAIAYTQRGRTSWCDKTYPEFQAAVYEARQRNQKQRQEEYLNARVEELNESRADMGLPSWRFHSSEREGNLAYWYGSAKGKAPLRNKRVDDEELEIARARSERTREMRALEDDAGSTITRLLTRLFKRRRGRKPSKVRRMFVNLRLLFRKNKNMGRK